MNIPFLAKHGVAYGGTTGKTAPTTVRLTWFSYWSASIENGPQVQVRLVRINQRYGQAADFKLSHVDFAFGPYPEAAGVVEAIGPQVQVTSGDVSVVYQGDDVKSLKQDEMHSYGSRLLKSCIQQCCRIVRWRNSTICSI